MLHEGDGKRERGKGRGIKKEKGRVFGLRGGEMSRLKIWTEKKSFNGSRERGGGRRLQQRDHTKPELNFFNIENKQEVRKENMN